MSMAPTTESPAPASDLGQRFFVFGVFAIMVAEVAVTVSNMGQRFLWTSCMLGVVSSVGILALGNWLYNGDKTALLITRAWVGLQILLIILGLCFKLSDAADEGGLHSHLGVNAMWQGYIKLFAYLLFAGMLFLPGLTLDFFATQRGETPTPKPAASMGVEAAAGSPVDLAVDQTAAIDGLSGAMKMVSGVLILVGVFELLTALQRLQEYFSAISQNIETSPAVAILGIVEALAVAALGAVLLCPAKAAVQLVDAKPRNMGLVMNFFTHLLASYKAYVLILLVLALVAVCRLIFTKGF
ncbi:MAG TPA: hypothetical protein VE988_26295 [Gemmataceae bacterium]|nr:hypothetical protein [Gemmataceae bacterium]